VRSALLAAAREFNSGRYFEAHERLEEALDDVGDDLWELFVGLIQVAVGYHKVAGALPGGPKMLGLGLAKLAAYPADAARLDLERFRERVRGDLALLERGALDPASLRGDPPRLRALARR
jgi:predicted metal-dependent hydrolase